MFPWASAALAEMTPSLSAGVIFTSTGSKGSSGVRAASARSASDSAFVSRVKVSDMGPPFVLPTIGPG